MTTPRKPRAQHVLTVDSTVKLGPHLVRVILTDDCLGEFPETGHTDDYVKLLFASPESGAQPPYDMAALRAAGQLLTRTYTVRWVDRAARRLAIDFVVHGDEGLAGPWAMRARAGDRLVLAGPGSGYVPSEDARAHLLAGDLSALPAIASACEFLPDGARGLAMVEVPDLADAVELAAPAGLRVQWLVNPDAADTGFLARAITAAGLDGAGLQVFAHGERESVKAMRRVFKELGVPRERLSISGYWARGRTEDVFQEEKRQPIGAID